MIDIESAPRDGTWIWLYGLWLGEHKGCLGFWSTEGQPGDWFDSEAASHSLTGFGWQPTHWMPFVGVDYD